MQQLFPFIWHGSVAGLYSQRLPLQLSSYQNPATQVPYSNLPSLSGCSLFTELYSWLHNKKPPRVPLAAVVCLLDTDPHCLRSFQTTLILVSRFTGASQRAYKEQSKFLEIPLSVIDEFFSDFFNYSQMLGCNASAWKQFISGFKSSTRFTAQNPLLGFLACLGKLMIQEPNSSVAFGWWTRLWIGRSDGRIHYLVISSHLLHMLISW